MSKVSIQGDASGTGTLTIAAPNTNSNYTLTLPTNTGTVMTSASNTFSGGLTLGGDLTLDSNGIYLGGTAAANYLDDYEEGTWTPNMDFGSATFSNPIYTKIGRLVTVSVAIADITDATTASAVTVEGLPFTSASNNRAIGAVLIRYVNGGSFITSIIGNSSSEVVFYQNFLNGAAYSGLDYDEADRANWDLQFSITYTTDA